MKTGKRSGLWLVLLMALAGRAQGELGITSVRSDGRELDLKPVTGEESPGALRIPAGTRELQFAFAGEVQAKQPYRLRFKLEGYDQDWRNLFAHMRLVVRVLDEANTIIAATEFTMNGTSAGWRGGPETSDFTPGGGEVIAPERAAKVQLWCVSGGPEYTLGLIAFRNLVVRVGQPGEEGFMEMRYSTETGRDLDVALGSPEDWRRDGSRPAMAEVLRIEKPERHHALALRDIDTRKFAAWLNPLHKCMPVRPGDRIRVEWQECHWIGSGGPGLISYERLPAGNYWFRVAAVGMDGTPVAEEVSVPLTVLPPLWGRWWFWVATGTLSSLGAIWGVRRGTQRRMQRQVERAERQHLLERERTRIARDIHDDLGTTLTRISMLSESARSNPRTPPETAHDLDRICAAVRECTQAMDEIVWAADPENDSVDELATYISGYAQELLTSVGVRCRLRMPARFPAENLSAEVRHNIFLAFKESLNNALKHGQATEVEVSMEADRKRLSLRVEDNGRGFEQPAHAGHGLANMRNRMEKLGGEFKCESQVGRGAVVWLSVPLEPKRQARGQGDVVQKNDKPAAAQPA